MTAPDRRCGTCVWWEHTVDHWGKCEWSTTNMPQSLRDTRDMQQDEGTDCAMWSDGADAGEGGDE